MAGASEAPFVGRETELAALRRCLRTARGHVAQVVLVEGDAGIGKSTLVRFFLREAQPDDNVLRASGDEREGAIAYGVVAQLTEQIPPNALRQTPGLRTQPLHGSDPLVIGAELACAWGTLARLRSVIVVIEDLHWADIPSCDALLSAVRRLRAVRALLVATCRPDELAHFGGRWERFAGGDERCTRIRLGGLGADAVRAFARQVRRIDVPRGVAERIVEHTGGNPLYMTALVEELPSSALLELGGSLPAPRSLASVITSRLAALPDQPRSLVIAAAVLGRSCPLVAAAHLAGLGDPVRPLEQAHAVRLLQEVPGTGGREVRFPHPVVHAAVYEDLGPARRRDLHHRAASLTPGLAALSHRVAASVGRDGPLACELEMAATEHEQQGDLLLAAELWRQASDLSPDEAERDTRLVRTLHCLILAGDLLGAEALRPAVERCHASSLQQFALGSIAFANGDAGACEGHLRQAWALGDERGDMAAALDAAAILGELLIHMGRLAEAEQHLRTALAGCSADARQHRTLLGKLAIALVGQDRMGEARAVIADPAFPPSVATCERQHLDAMFVRGCARLWSEQLEGARLDFAQILERAHEFSGLRFEYLDALVLVGLAEFRLGRWGEALEHLEHGVALAHEIELAWIYPYAHGSAAMLRALRGDWCEAEAHVAAARAGESHEFVLGVFFAAAGAAVLAWARGNPTALLNLLADPASASAAETFGHGMFAFGPIVVDALLDLGRIAEAEQRLTATEDVASRQELPSVALQCLRLRGRLESIRGDADAASIAFAAGREVAREVAVPFDAAMHRLEHGRFLRAGGRARAAVQEFTEAHQIFLGLGARPFVDAVTRELRASGMPTSTSPPDAPSQLSERELRVARLVADGRTNRQIGAELCITGKAVEYHLARIYAKLAIASRAELGAWMSRASPPG